MKRLDQGAVSALKTLLDGQPTTEAKVSFAWAIAAGPTLARAATVSWHPNGTLHVVARTDAWMQEIVRARPLIARRIAELVGPETVRKVVISVVPDESVASNLAPASRNRPPDA
jgi:hypothetical protein